MPATESTLAAPSESVMAATAQALILLLLLDLLRSPAVVVPVLVLLAWVVYENRRLIQYSIRGRIPRGEEPPPQPGIAQE